MVNFYLWINYTYALYEQVQYEYFADQLLYAFFGNCND